MFSSRRTLTVTFSNLAVRFHWLDADALCFNLNRQLSSLKPPAHSPAGLREENGKVKVRKLSTLDEVGLVAKAKAVYVRKAK